MNTDIHKLLRLKRYEHPTPDYFERFLDQFHERQRAEGEGEHADGRHHEREPVHAEGDERIDTVHEAQDAQREHARSVDGPRHGVVPKGRTSPRFPGLRYTLGCGERRRAPLPMAGRLSE